MFRKLAPKTKLIIYTPVIGTRLKEKKHPELLQCSSTTSYLIQLALFVLLCLFFIVGFIPMVHSPIKYASGLAHKI